MYKLYRSLLYEMHTVIRDFLNLSRTQHIRNGLVDDGEWWMIQPEIKLTCLKTEYVQSFYLYNFFQRIVGVIHSNNVVSSGFVIDYILHHAGDTDYKVKKDQNLQQTAHLYSYTWVSCKDILNKLELYLFIY